MLKDRLIEQSLRIKKNLLEFKEATKDKQEKLKREFQHDIKELDGALNNFLKNKID